jgi:nitric oxide dioxygenase
MLSAHHAATVSATVPALRAHGGEITRVFYRTMLAAHPELFDYFNPANQRDGGQAASLAASVLAYATHIVNPAPLAGMIERISSKHVSLQVRPEYYLVVGQHLLGAIVEVLGGAATPDVIEAWTAAYGQLAAIMIGRETELSRDGPAQPGGWQGFKPFRVVRKVRESEVTASFHLAPLDGAGLPPFQPGQYVSIRVRAPGFAHPQVRQYSLSAAPDGQAYRISVKREDAPAGALVHWTDPGRDGPKSQAATR